MDVKLRLSVLEGVSDAALLSLAVHVAKLAIMESGDQYVFINMSQLKPHERL